jgi:dTDP-4-dehydrorhamnose reductase
VTWLILGANGQLGKSLIAVLKDQGIPFIALGSQELDITSSVQCSELIGVLSPCVIINAAAWTDVDGAESNPDSAYAVNAIGPKNIVAAAKLVGAIFAHISTDYVFSGISEVPWEEDDSFGPISVYGITKAAGEAEVMSEYPDRSYIFRTAWLYSRWGKNFTKTMTRLALFGDGEVRVVNDQVGQPTAASDLALQIVSTILTELPFGIYHGTNSGEASWFEFAQKIFELSGKSTARVVPVSSSEFVRPAKRPAYSVLGHGAWNNATESGYPIDVMRNWQLALTEEMPRIIEMVLDENRIK